MGSLEALAISSLEATALALLGVFLFHVHKRTGIIPFLFLVTALALMVPFTAHTAAMEFGVQGATPQVHAIVVPVFLALVLLLHLTMGWRNAQVVGALPLLSGILVGAGVLVSRVASLHLPVGLLPETGLGPFIVGLAASFAALMAAFTVQLLLRVSGKVPVLPLLVVGGLSGLAFHGILLTIFVVLGLPVGGITYPAIVAVPVIVGLVPLIFTAIATEARLSGLSHEMRRELLSAPPFGSRSLVDDYARAEQLYREGISEGQAEAASYLALLEDHEEGAYVAEAGGRIEYANKALAHVLGRPGEELQGKNVLALFEQPGRRGRPGEPGRHALEPGTHTTFVILPNGHKRHVELKVRNEAGGKLHGHVCDLTPELVRRELARQKHRAELYLNIMRHRVSERIQEPLETLQELRDAGLAQGRVQARVTRATRDLEDVTRFLERVDLLATVERASAGPYDAGVLLRRVGKRFAKREADRLTVTWELPDEVVRVWGSEVLDEVFAALVDNAVRHATDEHVHVTLAAQRDGSGNWVLRVDDNGPGTPEHVRETLEAPADPEEVNGIGLGLHLARSIVQALGGSLTVEDRVPGEPERGSSYRVRLSAAPASRAIPERGVGEGRASA